MSELNRDQIIKALECCASPTQMCKDCPMPEEVKDDCRCMETISRNAISLIKELTEENERLSVQVEMWKSTAYCEKDRVNSIKVDTVRKMQERLTKEFDRMHKSNFITVEERQWIIDQIAKEMIGGQR